MRDYQFGAWLMTLRNSSGYSQFQLGKLLGVSDKAVSKWETGAAKPRMATCSQLATIFGISLDDLMACRQPKEGNRIYSKQSEAEERLWQEARDQLHQIYGEHPPLAFQSRLDAEEMLVRGTGMIQHLQLKRRLLQEGICDSISLRTNAPLTAWLMDSSMINPLQPHTFCPKCHKTTLHPEVKDGWDLPEEICECGTPLVREGHDIRLDMCEQQFADMDRTFHIQLFSPDEPRLRKLITEQYGDTWRMVEYQTPRFDKYPYRTFALLPKGAEPSFPKKNGIYQLSSGKNLCHIIDIPEVVVYITIQNSERLEMPKSEETTPNITLNDLLKEDFLERAKLHINTVPAFTVASNGNGECAFITGYGIEKRGYTILRQYEAEDISSFFPEKLTFSAIMQGYIIRNSWELWHEALKDAVRQGGVSIMDIPLTLEDLLETIKQKMLANGIPDKGIALKAISSIQTGEFDKENLQALSALGFEEWFINSLINHGFPKHKEAVIEMVIDWLERIARRPVLGIGQTIYKTKKRKGME